MLTVLLAAAVPVNVNVLSLVMRSPATPLSFENEAIVGTPGAAVSIVTVSAAEAALVLPAASAARAVRLWAASASATVVNDHPPLPLAVAAPKSVAPS